MAPNLLQQPSAVSEGLALDVRIHHPRTRCLWRDNLRNAQVDRSSVSFFFKCVFFSCLRACCLSFPIALWWRVSALAVAQSTTGVQYSVLMFPKHCVLRVRYLSNALKRYVEALKRNETKRNSQTRKRAEDVQRRTHNNLERFSLFALCGK